MTMDILTSIEPIWRVLAVGLVLGAGLPALFALGIHFGATHTTEDGTLVAASPLARVGSWICFGVVGVAILFGLSVLVAADHVLPAVGLG